MKPNPITYEMLSRFAVEAAADSKLRLLSSAVSKTDLADVAYHPTTGAKLQNTFSVEIKTDGITNQKRSGRCWLFASMNLMRERVAEKCSIEHFELSGNYLAFWDKFEKIN